MLVDTTALITPQHDCQSPVTSTANSDVITFTSGCHDDEEAEIRADGAEIRTRARDVDFPTANRTTGVEEAESKEMISRRPGWN